MNLFFWGVCSRACNCTKNKKEKTNHWCLHWPLSVVASAKATPYMPFKSICSSRQNPITAIKAFELYIPNLNLQLLINYLIDSNLINIGLQIAFLHSKKAFLHTWKIAFLNTPLKKLDINLHKLRIALV